MSTDDFVTKRSTNGGGGGEEDDDDDIFKSAIGESRSGDRDEKRLVVGESEIDLGDEEEEEEEEEDGFPTTQEQIGVGSDEESMGEKQNGSKALVGSPPNSTLTFSQSTLPGREGGSSGRAETWAEHQQGVEEGGYLEITVTEPQKQGDGMSGFIVYRVTTRTNIPLFRRKEFAVWRRFSDFLGLQAKLAEKYCKKGRIVPPAPEKNMIGTTKIKISGGGQGGGGGGGSGDGANQSDFLERRRAGLERFLNRTSAHATLRIDPDFRDFLEIDSDLPKSTGTSAWSGAGVVRLLNRFGDTVNKISYKMDESDRWFEEKSQNIEALETQLRKVHVSIELLVSNRKDLAVSTGSFAKTAAILSNAEEHTGLARALAQLAEVEEKVEGMHGTGANSDFFLFSELLKDYIALIGCVKEVLQERVKAYQTWQHAQQMLNKKREAKAKLELQGRNERLAAAREEVVQWEGKVEESGEEFTQISTVIKKELEEFEGRRVKEFKGSILKYLESLLSHQEEMVKYWETFLPEAKAISLA